MTDQSAGALAAVVFEGPGGPDGLVIREADADRVSFGRGAACPIRFGHAPEPDLGLARVAGTFLVAAGRLLVEGPPRDDAWPVQLCMADRLPLELAPGEVHGPAAAEYDVIVRGERSWVLHVRARGRTVPGVPGGAGDDPPTERRPLALSEHERRVLDAYVAPLRAGRLEPSTHAEVAEQLAYSINKVRRDLYGIWQRMVTCGVPLPDLHDKRMAVAHAALTNRLV